MISNDPTAPADTRDSHTRADEQEDPGALQRVCLPPLPRGMSGLLVLGTVQHLCLTLAKAHADDDLREALRTDVKHNDPLVENLAMRYLELAIHAEKAIKNLERVVALHDPA